MKLCVLRCYPIHPDLVLLCDTYRSDLRSRGMVSICFGCQQIQNNTITVLITSRISFSDDHETRLADDVPRNATN